MTGNEIEVKDVTGRIVLYGGLTARKLDYGHRMQVATIAAEAGWAANSPASRHTVSFNTSEKVYCLAVANDDGEVWVFLCPTSRAYDLGKWYAEYDPVKMAITEAACGRPFCRVIPSPGGYGWWEAGDRCTAWEPTWVTWGGEP